MDYNTPGAFSAPITNIEREIMSNPDSEDTTVPEERDIASESPLKNREVSESVDTIFEVLTDCDRRAIVRYFLDATTETATVSELATYCHDESDGKTGTEPLERMVARLHHKHLPKLADAGIVEYDARSDTVRYRGDPLLESLVEFIWTLDQ